MRFLPPLVLPLFFFAGMVPSASVAADSTAIGAGNVAAAVTATADAAAVATTVVAAAAAYAAFATALAAASAGEGKGLRSLRLVDGSLLSCPQPLPLLAVQVSCCCCRWCFRSVLRRRCCRPALACC